jgi:hypothetical protein
VIETFGTETTMARLTPAAHRLFATQHGVAGVDQLVAAGLSTRQIKRLEADGSLIGVLRGAYRTPSVELDEFGRCAAVCLARPAVAVSGPTAGRMWEFRRLPRDRRIHVIGPPASQPAIAPWVVTYRTAAIRDIDSIGRDDGIRVTTRARTAFDLARHLQPGDLRSVIEQAMHDGGHTAQEMLAVASDWLSPRRPWATTFVRLVEGRMAGGAAESHPEVRVGNALERAGVRGLVRQFGIDLPRYGRARFDLAVPRLSWAIEIDVHPTHEETAGRAADRDRDDAAAAIGWSISRISADAYTTAFDRSIAVLLDRYCALESSRTGPFEQAG